MERARQAEKAPFDFVFVVDSQLIAAALPEPAGAADLLPALAVSTERIGLVATITTSYAELFYVAPQLASVDLISHGRAGWKVVTSGDHGSSRVGRRWGPMSMVT